PARKPGVGKPAPAVAPSGPIASSAEAPAQRGGNRIFSSPLARRLANEAGLDLTRVQGSGPHGRVIARDVEAAKSGKGLRAPGVVPAGGGDNLRTMVPWQGPFLFPATPISPSP